jgi:hypothetical protein
VTGNAGILLSAGQPRLWGMTMDTGGTRNPEGPTHKPELRIVLTALFIQPL